MLINENNYLGLNLKHLAKPIINSFMGLASSRWSDEDYIKRRYIITSFFEEADNKPYLITKKALNDIELIKVGKNFDFTLLAGIKEQKTTYLINENLCFRFFIDGYFLRVLILKRSKKPEGYWTDYLVINMDLVTGDMTDVDQVMNYDEETYGKDIKLFIKCLIFVEIADSELVYINSGQKIGTKRDGYFNLQPSKVVIVNSTWNKITVRTEGFSVSGHFRLQRYGEGRNEVKLIWIEPFAKQGYIRNEGNN